MKTFTFELYVFISNYFHIFVHISFNEFIHFNCCGIEVINSSFSIEFWNIHIRQSLVLIYCNNREFFVIEIGFLIPWDLENNYFLKIEVFFRNLIYPVILHINSFFFILKAVFFLFEFLIKNQIILFFGFFILIRIKSFNQYLNMLKHEFFCIQPILSKSKCSKRTSFNWFLFRVRTKGGH